MGSAEHVLPLNLPLSLILFRWQAGRQAKARHRQARAHDETFPTWRISTIRYTEGVDSKAVTAGTLLRQARRRAGLSQAELATQAGVTQSVVSAYESGQRQPSIPVLARLIEAAGRL